VAKQTWTRPSAGILFSPPNDFVKESEKTVDWFTQYSRWAVATFYNQPRQAFYSGDIVDKGIAQEAIENWSYVFGNQNNYRYKYMTTDFSGNQLPVQWIPGGKIGSLVDHLRGIMLTSVENIEVTVKNLSKNVASMKSKMMNRLMFYYEFKDMLDNMLPEGMDYKPVREAPDEINSKEDVVRFIESWQDKYSILAEKIGQSQIYQDRLKEKFLQSGVNQIVGGLSAILTEVQNGKVVNTVIPDYEVIWDNRDNDPFNNQAYLCGYVKHNVPYQEIIRRYKQWLTPEEMDEIRLIASNGYDNMEDFLFYYNVGFGVDNRFNWWHNAGTSNMTMTTATIYWIAPRDWRYRTLPNRMGVERVLRINDNETYAGEKNTQKGKDMLGDYEGWDIHMATLIGNKYIVNYGYMPNALRENDNKGRPLLPMRIFCSGMAINQGKSIVRKLVPLQDELDMYAYKIKEKVAKDVGKVYVFNGNKFNGITSTEIINDLKSIGVFVSDGGSGEVDDPQNGQRMVEPVDMTLDANIIRYAELRQALENEMEMICSVSKIALGQQGAVIGKSVQEQTINQNSYGTATLMWGLMKHFNQVLQYNVNLKQMVYQFTESVEESLNIGETGSYLLKIMEPEEFGTQPFMVYLDISNALDPQQRAELKSIALSEAQNGRLDTVDYIEHIMMAPTLNQAVRGLKYSREKQRQKTETAQMQQSQMQMQHEADIAMQKAQNDAALLQVKEDNANFRAELQAISKNLQVVLQRIQGGIDGISPLTMQMQNAAIQQQMQQQQAGATDMTMEDLLMQQQTGEGMIEQQQPPMQ
jgi:hypothetical protein